MPNPFAAGTRPWTRITEALRAASTTVRGRGELVITDSGRLLVPDGVKADKDLSPVTTAAEVAATYATLDGLGAERLAAADAVVDDSASMQAFINGQSRGHLRLRAVSPADGTSAPSYQVLNTLDLPFTKSLSGDGFRSRIRVPAAQTLTNGVLVRANVDASHNWVKAYPGMPATHIRDLVIDARNAGNITAFEFGGYHTFEDIFGISTDQLIKQINQYCDQVTIRRIYSYGKPDSGNYLIDLPSNGDALLIEQIHSYVDASSAYRAKLLHLRYRNGAIVRGLINGDVLIEDCTTLDLSALHLETGQLTLTNTSGNVHEGIFYMRDAAALKVSPVVVQQRSGASSTNGDMVELSDLLFAYFTAFTPPTDGTPNFQILTPSTTPRLLVHVNNVARTVGKDGDEYGTRILLGSTCGMADFDNYSHLASVRSKFLNGAWEITGALPAQTTGAGITASGLTLDSFCTWKGTSGTYFYKVVGYVDKQRRIGIIGSSEQSIAATNTGQGVSISLNSEMRANLMLRVYRGTATGSYSSYVDVPLLSGGRLYDDGVTIGGYPWQARTAGPVDAVNENLTDGLDIRPGISDAASDAYGHVRVVANTNAIPTTGGWRKGDEVVLRTPVSTDAGGWLYGWRRATDCLSTAPSNVRGMDWIPITAPRITYSSVSPNGSVVGGYGDVVLRTDGSNEEATLYLKQPGTAGSSSGWIPVKTITPYTATTAQLTSATATINTSTKLVGKQVFNTDTGKPVWATGTAATATWKDATGTIAHTPA